MKRFLTLFIIVLLATAAWSAKTAQAIWTEGNTTLTFTYGNLATVGGTYNGQTVTAVWSGTDVTDTGIIEPGWNETVKGSVTTVVFKSVFKDVKPTSCHYWFDGFANLTTITDISNLNTSNVTDMEEMFYGCKSLTSLDLSSFNTANVTTMSFMFYGCESLSALTFGSNFKVDKVTYMWYMFGNCKSLASLNLSNLNTANVANMSNMFRGCTNLSILNLGGNFNTTNVTSMSYMFYGCKNLSSLTLGSNFKTNNVTDMSGMFQGCSSLNSLDLSSFNTANVKRFGYLFSGCSKLTNLIFPSLDTTNRNELWNHDYHYMFENCSSLKNLELSQCNIPNEFYFDGIPDQCFVYMPAGVSEDIKSQRSKNLVLKSGSSWTCANCIVATETDYDFCYPFTATTLTTDGTSASTYYRYSNGALKATLKTRNNVSIPKGLSLFSEYNAQAIWTAGNTTLTFTSGQNVAVGGTFGGQTVTNMWIGSNVAATGTNDPGWIDTVKGSVTKVVFDSSFKSVKPTSCYSWFISCGKLTTIKDISNLTTTNVTNLCWMFDGCSSLTSLDLSSFITTNVKDMYCMFKGCSSLTSLDFSSFNTAKVTDMESMFDGCSSLTSLDLSSFNTTNVTSMHCMFDGCSSLTSLDLSSFNTANVKDMYLMFRGCSSLKNLDMSNFNTSTVKFCSSMFSSVPAQCFVYMPTGVINNIKNQRSKNLVLKDGSTWTCASCEMTADTEYDILYEFKATALSVTGSSAMAYCLYKDGTMYSTLTNFANVTIPKGKDKISETFPAMAIWTEGNTTLTFLVSDSYKAGDTYNGQTITNVWKGKTVSSSTTTPAWLETVQGTMTKVVFASSFKYVKPTTCRNWFCQCGKLATITNIGNLNTSEVISMRQMFRECTSLTSLNLSTFDTQKVISMRTMFYGCTGLTSLNISNFSTASANNIGYMFYNCKKLTSIDVSKFNTDKVTAMDGVFYNCAALTTLDVTNFNTQKVTTMESMFRGCSKLTSIDASNFSYDVLTTYTEMFEKVPELCFVYMSDGMPDDLKSQKPKNLVLRSGSNWTCDNCVLADGETLTLPYGFKALGGVTYERSIAANNGNGYTVFLPYDCPIPEGVTAYTLRTDEQSLLGEDKIVFAPIEGDVLEAYNPYLLVNSGNDLTNLNTTVDTQVLPTTTATAEKTFGDMRFTGTMRTISNEEAAELGAYIMQTGCRWKKVMTSSPSAYIPAYRAYLISPSGEAQTRATLFDGTTVGIDPVAKSGKMLAGGDNIYDLQGRCVATKGQWSIANGQLSIATGKLPKGVYITNGHRYVVK